MPKKKVINEELLKTVKKRGRPAKPKPEPKPKKEKKLKPWFKITPPPKGYRLASMEEAMKANKVMYWGIKKASPNLLNKPIETKNDLIIKLAGLRGKLSKLKKEIESEKNAEIKKQKISEFDTIRNQLIELNEKYTKMSGSGKIIIDSSDDESGYSSDSSNSSF